MKDFQEKLDSYYSQLRELRNAIRLTEKDREEFILEQAVKDFPLLNIKQLSVGYDWACKKGPLGFCVYDDKADPCHDSCLYCCKPEERL